eukprot:scaffold6407_cov62-Phaeocystis_antarctica.AAC.2
MYLDRVRVRGRVGVGARAGARVKVPLGRRDVPELGCALAEGRAPAAKVEHRLVEAGDGERQAAQVPLGEGRVEERGRVGVRAVHDALLTGHHTPPVLALDRLGVSTGRLAPLGLRNVVRERRRWCLLEDPRVAAVHAAACAEEVLPDRFDRLRQVETRRTPCPAGRRRDRAAAVGLDLRQDLTHERREVFGPLLSSRREVRDWLPSFTRVPNLLGVLHGLSGKERVHADFSGTARKHGLVQIALGVSRRSGRRGGSRPCQRRIHSFHRLDAPEDLGVRVPVIQFETLERRQRAAVERGDKSGASRVGDLGAVEVEHLELLQPSSRRRQRTCRRWRRQKGGEALVAERVAREMETLQSGQPPQGRREGH